MDNNTRDGTPNPRTVLSGNSRSVSTSTSHHVHPASLACVNQYISCLIPLLNLPPAGLRRQVAISLTRLLNFFLVTQARSLRLCRSLRNQSSRSSTVGVSRRAA